MILTAIENEKWEDKIKLLEEVPPDETFVRQFVCERG